MLLVEPNKYEELLVGCHTYTRNGVIIESSMSNYNEVAQGNKKKCTLYFWTLSTLQSDNILGMLKDINKKKRLHVNLRYIAGNPEQLRWDLVHGADVIVRPAELETTMPLQITCTKQ